MSRIELVKKYFSAWILSDALLLEDIFDDMIYYSECYGPEYHGINEIKRWFNDWNQHGQVLTWDVLSHVEIDQLLVVEWYFKFEYQGELAQFTGVSLIMFNNDDKILSIKEFQSSLPKYDPYQNKKTTV